MSVLFKYTIKNVFSKPFRTLILTVCIICCGFVAMLSLDVLNNIEDMLHTVLSQVSGTADLVVNDNVGISEELELSYENEQLMVYIRKDGTVEVPNGLYAYFQKKSFSVCTMDYDKAFNMKLLGTVPVLSDSEAAISKRFSDKQGKKVGDVVVLTDDFGEEREFTIKEIIPNIGFANGREAVFLSTAGYEKLTENNRASIIYIDVIGDVTSREAVEEAKDIVYNGEVINLLDNEEIKSQIASLSLIFFMVFLVCFFLVIFVAISVSSRIVCERMSVIGTFRSLGISGRFTTGLLLVENAVYGLIGGVSGWLLFSLVRKTIYNTVFTVSAYDGIEIDVTVKPIQVWTIIVVVLLSVLIMVACPLKEILKTSKMAIRDVIFDNKDTAYVMKRATTVIGLILLVAAVVTFFIKQNALAQIVCFISIICSIALLFPWILKGVTMLLSKIFTALNLPVANMAAIESRSKKSTVGSAVLCVTAAVLSMVIIMLAGSVTDIYDLKTYDCDVHAGILYGEKTNSFQYIKDLEGVTEVETVYYQYTAVNVNGEKYDLNLFGLNEGGYRMLTAIKNCPTELDNNSIAIDEKLAKKMGVGIGDEVEIKFNSDSFMPITETLKVVAFIDSYEYDTTSNSILISKDLYIDINHDYASEILIRTANPDKTVESIKKYSSTKIERVETIEEYDQNWKQKGAGTIAFMVFIVCVGIGLTVVGMASNQIIGFAGRKRECAVLASTAMSKGKIGRMFFLEGFFAYGTALAVALPSAFCIIIPFTRVMNMMDTGMDININIPLYAGFTVALFVVFMLVTLFPITALKKMKISEQLKYE